MILIADGGSTNTTWCLLNNGKNELVFQTEGYHPFFVDTEYITQSLRENLPQKIKDVADQVANIYFYSAGGGYSQESDGILIKGISNLFNIAKIIVETDLLAAARALLKHEKGFAAILGTGTNTCIYNGKDVVHNIESLGFLLGDEGSGSYIGKKLIGDYIRGYMPSNVKNEFFNEFKLSPEEILNNVYTSQTANAYCASFSNFVGSNLESNTYYYQLVYNSFQDLFKNIVTNYPDYEKYSFNCIGSIAYYFQTVLEKVAFENGMQIGKIYKNPMEGLIEFHLKS
ncbi:MAG: N-acetylglucosamine kinase [Dysgonamonadaceae bacterium]|nr:N-acetylglucosamine kinase [Dysgonamonadaceae bacterium]